MNPFQRIIRKYEAYVEKRDGKKAEAMRRKAEENYKRFLEEQKSKDKKDG